MGFLLESPFQEYCNYSCPCNMKLRTATFWTASGLYLHVEHAFMNRLRGFQFKRHDDSTCVILYSEQKNESLYIRAKKWLKQNHADLSMSIVYVSKKPNNSMHDRSDRCTKNLIIILFLLFFCFFGFYYYFFFMGRVVLCVYYSYSSSTFLLKPYTHH